MNAKEWLIVLAAGAAGPAAILGAAPLTLATGIAAALSFIVGAGAGAKALHMQTPANRKNPNGSAVDAEDPK